MTKEEFVERHGEEAWEELVRPLQQGCEPLAPGKGQGTSLADDFIGRICTFVNTVGWPRPKVRNLKEARVHFCSVCGEDAWEAFYENARILYFKSKGMHLRPPVSAGQFSF